MELCDTLEHYECYSGESDLGPPHRHRGKEVNRVWDGWAAALILSKRETAHQAVTRDNYGKNVPEKEDLARVMLLEEYDIHLGKRKADEILETEQRDIITRKVYQLLQPYRKKEEGNHFIELNFRKGKPKKEYSPDREKEAHEVFHNTFSTAAIEVGKSNCELTMIAKAVAALTLQAMAYVGWCLVEELLSKSAYNTVRENVLNSVVKFVLSVFDMEDFERIYNLSVVKDEYSALCSNLCNSNCDTLIAVAEGRVEVDKFSTLREHDICDIIQQCQDCAYNKDFEVCPWSFSLYPVEWNDISKSDITSAMREVLKYVPLKEDCKMQLTLELTCGKCYHVLDNLIVEALKDVKIQELYGHIADVSHDESQAEMANAMLYDFTQGIITGLCLLANLKGNALEHFQKAVIFPLSRGSFGPCTDELSEVIKIADHERRMQCQRFISVEHILFGLSLSRVGDYARFLLNDRGLKCLGRLPLKHTAFSIYKLSHRAATILGDKEVGLEHLVLAIFFGKQEDDPIKRMELEDGSSLVFDDDAWDPELLKCLRSSDTKCSVKSFEDSDVFEKFLPENCRLGALVTCNGIMVMENLQKALKSGMILSPIREES